MRTLQIHCDKCKELIEECFTVESKVDGDERDLCEGCAEELNKWFGV